MKGIILAGGKGTRLQPATFYLNKHMISIINRPMIEYPIETLKTLGINDILIVSGGNHIGSFTEYLGDGSRYEVDLTYKVQADAGGIAQALALGKKFTGDDKVAVILGDNIFDNSALMKVPHDIDDDREHLFVKTVHDPERFGVYSKEENKIFEKPKSPISNLAVTGLYIYTNRVFDIVPTLIPSNRGELEITDLNNVLLRTSDTEVHDIGQTFWSDAGTPQSLCRVINWINN